MSRPSILDLIQNQTQGFNMDLPYYYNTNVKPVCAFQADTTWSAPPSGTVSVDTANVKLGSQSIKLAEDNNVAGSISSEYTFLSALNLTTFPDGSTSSTGDYIRFACYVSDVTKVDTGAGLGITIALYNGASKLAAIRLWSGSSPVVATGWNFISITKNNMEKYGGFTNSDFSNITKIQIGWTSTINASGAYVSFQLLDMVRVDPISSSFPNPFQKNVNGTMTKDFTINTTSNNCSFWFVGNEFLQLTARDIKADFPSSYGINLLGQIPCSDFTISAVAKVNAQGNYTQYNGWAKDNNNLILGIVYGSGSSTLSLMTKVGGSAELNLTTPFPTIIAGDIIYFTLTKLGAIVTLRAYKNGDISNTVEISSSTAMTGVGYACEYGISSVYSSLNNLSLSTISNVDHANKADWAQSVGQGTWQIIEAKTLVAGLSQVDFINISPNWKKLQILFLTQYSVSTVRDLWVRINDAVGVNYLYVYSQATGSAMTVSGASSVAQFVLPKGIANGQSEGVIFIDDSQLVSGVTLIKASYGTYDGGAYIYNVSGNAWISPNKLYKISLIASADAMWIGSRFILMGLR